MMLPSVPQELGNILLLLLLLVLLVLLAMLLPVFLKL
jgi:hypothetical protein